MKPTDAKHTPATALYAECNRLIAERDALRAERDKLRAALYRAERTLSGWPNWSSDAIAQTTRQVRDALNDALCDPPRD